MNSRFVTNCFLSHKFCHTFLIWSNVTEYVWQNQRHLLSRKRSRRARVSVSISSMEIYKIWKIIWPLIFSMKLLSMKTNSFKMSFYQKLIFFTFSMKTTAPHIGCSSLAQQKSNKFVVNQSPICGIFYKFGFGLNLILNEAYSHVWWFKIFLLPIKNYFQSSCLTVELEHSI